MRQRFRRRLAFTAIRAVYERRVTLGSVVYRLYINRLKMREEFIRRLMTRHTIHSGLLRLYYAFEKVGAPWSWEAWKSITGVQHGLFPLDDSRLPKGWTREMANAIHTYFEAYRALTTEGDRAEFASSKAADNFSGRDYWRKWVCDMWPAWRIQLRIQKAFEDCNIMPFQVMVANDLTEIPESTPIADANDRIAYALFGDDGLDLNGKIKHGLRDSVHIFAWRAAQNIRSQAGRLIARLKDKERRIEMIFDGMFRYEFIATYFSTNPSQDLRRRPQRQHLSLS